MVFQRVCISLTIIYVSVEFIVHAFYLYLNKLEMLFDYKLLMLFLLPHFVADVEGFQWFTDANENG